MKVRKTNFQPDEDDRPPVYEQPHPLRKVPGQRGAEWDRRIGRWVIYRKGR